MRPQVLETLAHLLTCVTATDNIVKFYSNCDGKGQCACKDGYTGVSTGCKASTSDMPLFVLFEKSTGPSIIAWVIRSLSLTAKLIDDSCDSNSYCPVASSCTSGKCQCNSGTRKSSNKKYCVNSQSNIKLVGESCTAGKSWHFKSQAILMSYIYLELNKIVCLF